MIPRASGDTSQSAHKPIPERRTLPADFMGPTTLLRTRQEIQSSFLSDRHKMLNQMLEIRSYSQKSQHIMIVWHLYQKCEVKHSKIRPCGVLCLQSESLAVVSVDTGSTFLDAFCGNCQQYQRRNIPMLREGLRGPPLSGLDISSCVQEQAPTTTSS